MPDGTLEEWHARMIEHRSQQCMEGTPLSRPIHESQDHWRNGTLHQLLNGSFRQEPVCGLPNLPMWEERECYGACDGSGVMQNEIHVPSGVSYADSYSHAHGWDNVEEDRKQFGSWPTFKENFAQYEPTCEQFSVAPAINTDLPQPPPPPIPMACITSEHNNTSLPQPSPSLLTMGCVTSKHNKIMLPQPPPPPMPMGCDMSQHNITLPQPPPPPMPMACTPGHNQTMLAQTAPPAVKKFKIKNKALRQPSSHAIQPSSADAPPKEVQEATDVVQQKAAPEEAACGSFRTDAEISATGRPECATERVLQRWDDDIGLMVNGSLEDLCCAESESRSHGREWDQFAVNEKQFGVYSTYKTDLSQYSTPLNMKLIPTEVKNWAKRMAQEIESEGRPRGGEQKWCGNDWNDLDAGMLDQDNEEELWSSVPRTSAVGAPWSKPWARTQTAPTPQKSCGRTHGPARKSWEKPWPQWQIKSSS